MGEQVEETEDDEENTNQKNNGTFKSTNILENISQPFFQKVSITIYDNKEDL